jgi:hypothetical protein
MLSNSRDYVRPASEPERVYLEWLIRGDYERCHLGETLDDIKRWAVFSKETRACFGTWCLRLCAPPSPLLVYSLATASRVAVRSSLNHIEHPCSRLRLRLLQESFTRRNSCGWLDPEIFRPEQKIVERVTIECFHEGCQRLTQSTAQAAARRDEALVVSRKAFDESEIRLGGAQHFAQANLAWRFR